jgi:hypothetical protein
VAASPAAVEVSPVAAEAVSPAVAAVASDMLEYRGISNSEGFL